MCISDFSYQATSAFDDFKVPEDSPLRDIFRKTIPTYEAAQQALQEIASCFRGEIGAKNPPLVEKIMPLLNAEIRRVQRAIEINFHSQKGTITIPRSLAMIGLPIAFDSDLSKKKEETIECTIDGQKVYLDREMIIAFLEKEYDSRSQAQFPNYYLGRMLEVLCNEIQRKAITQERIIELSKLAVKIPPSMAMIGLPIALDSYMFKEKPGNIGCTIDGYKVYLDRKMVIDFVENEYKATIPPYLTDVALGRAIEEMCKEVWQKTLTPERIMELVNPAAARVFLVSNVQPSSGTTLPPVQQLVATYRARKWGDRIFIETRQGMTVVGGYFPKGDNEYERRRSHSIDQESFLQVLEAHNQQFAEPITQIKQDDAGYVEKLELHQGDQLYVRADLHSDLSSLLAQLDMLKASGHLDKNYRCRPGFHMVFLGDYTDRGANDIEILTLLLRLRMENPTSVHLIRGNHEDVGIQMEYSPEGLWMSKHETDLSNCYKSLPLALCVTVKDESGRNQYVHFSHGAFSPAVDLAPLFESTGSGMVVKQKPHMIERIFENKDEKADRKQKSALQTIKDMPEAATQGTSYQWSDIGHRRAPSTRADPGTLAAGHILSPEDIHEYGRYAGAKSSIKAFFMGHIHIFHEWLVARKKRLEGSQVEQKKVIATTMPVGGAGGAYSMFQEVRQGILLQAAPKVKDWTKQLAASEGRGENMVLRFQGTPCGVYQQFPSQAPGNSELFQW